MQKVIAIFKSVYNPVLKRQDLQKQVESIQARYIKERQKYLIENDLIK